MHASIKSLLNGRTGICLLSTNQVYVSKKHNSAEVVTICMLLLQLDIPASCLETDLWVRVPLLICNKDGEKVNANRLQVRILLSHKAG